MTKRQYYAKKIETKRSKTNENNTKHERSGQVKTSIQIQAKKYHKIQSIIIIITTTFHCW